MYNSYQDLSSEGEISDDDNETDWEEDPNAGDDNESTKRDYLSLDNCHVWNELQATNNVVILYLNMFAGF